MILSGFIVFLQTNQVIKKNKINSVHYSNQTSQNHMDKLKQLYQKVILQHNNAPLFFEKQPNYTHQIEAYNPICGDQFTLYLQVVENVINRATFYGYGCAISKAASSVLMKKIQGLSLDEAHQICVDYLEMIQAENAEMPADEDLKAFFAARDFPSRQQCAVLAWEAFVQDYPKK